MEIAAEILKILVGGAAGALFGWISGVVAGKQKAQSEIAAFRRSRQDTVDLSAASLIKELATDLAAGAHSMCWLTWQAQFAKEKFNGDRVEKYDAEMHELLPKIIGGHIALTALNASAGDRLNELVRMFLSLDARIGEAAVTRPEGIPQALALLYPNTLELNDRLRTDLRDVAASILLADAR